MYDLKKKILIIQKTLDEESSKRDVAHNDFMEFLKKMEEKIFEKFDFELSCKKEIEIKISNHLEEKFNIIKTELQKESKTRYDSIENLEYYFEVISLLFTFDLILQFYKFSAVSD